MTKREAEFLEQLIRDEYQTVLAWMSNGCEESLWDWQQSCRAYRPRRRTRAEDETGPGGLKRI